MKKGIINELASNDGKPVVEIKTFADIEKLKEYKKNKTDVRVMMNPADCIDPYPELVKAMTDLLGDPHQIGLVEFKKESKN